jgi:phospholipase C
VIPNYAQSEHPPASIKRGQAWVTSIINAVMRSKDWRSSAIFLTWDDWGGFYDHVKPPRVDSLGYGIRVPGLGSAPTPVRASSTIRC